MLPRTIALSFFLLTAQLLQAQSWQEQINIKAAPEFNMRYVGQAPNGAVYISKDDSVANPRWKLTIEQYMDSKPKAMSSAAAIISQIDSTYKVTVIEKVNTKKEKFVIFSIEQAPGFTKEMCGIYYIVEGIEIEFSVLLEAKCHLMTPEFITTWTSIFKRSKVTHKKV